MRVPSPQSIIFILNFSLSSRYLTRMFSGLISLWAIPKECVYFRVNRTYLMTLTAISYVIFSELWILMICTLLFNQRVPGPRIFMLRSCSIPLWNRTSKFSGCFDGLICAGFQFIRNWRTKKLDSFLSFLMLVQVLIHDA